MPHNDIIDISPGSLNSVTTPNSHTASPPKSMVKRRQTPPMIHHAMTEANLRPNHHPPTSNFCLSRSHPEVSLTPCAAGINRVIAELLRESMRTISGPGADKDFCRSGGLPALCIPLRLAMSSFDRRGPLLLAHICCTGTRGTHVGLQLRILMCQAGGRRDGLMTDGNGREGGSLEVEDCILCREVCGYRPVLSMLLRDGFLEASCGLIGCCRGPVHYLAWCG